MKGTKNLRLSTGTKVIVILWTSIFFVVFSISLLIYAVSEGFWGPLPTFEELENPENMLAAEVYSSDNKILGKYYFQNRTNTRFEQLPQNLINALIATEDARFYSHSGIDVRGLMRVLFKTVILRQSAGGGSTITQQLAKNLFHDKPSSKLERVKQKLKEWIIAVRLESRYTKDEIITMYLNTVEFGDNSFGIREASKTFFSKNPDSLDVQEAAVLVGMLKANYTFNPRAKPENAFNRRNVVFGQMNKYGYLSKAETDSLKLLPLEISYNKSTHVDGLAPYFREYLRLYIQNWCKSNLKVDGTPYNLYKDGLKIFTTIDSRMQLYAEEAMQEHMKQIQIDFFKNLSRQKDPWKEFPEELDRVVKQSSRYKELKDARVSKDSIEKVLNTPVPMKVFSWDGEIDTVLSPMDSIKYHRKFLQTGFTVMDPTNGDIKAWVGGTNYKYFKYDHVNENTKRQIGSTFKPFVYATAIDEGWSPCHEVPDVPVVFEDFNNWTPQNSDGKFSGQKYTLKRGLAESKNSVTAFLIKQVGPQAVIQRVRDMGVTSHLDPYPSIALGAMEISLIEMVGAYTTFANKGFYSKPRFLKRIEDKNGNLIQEFPTETKEVLSEQTAYIMIEMLRNNLIYQKGVNEGTGARLKSKYKLTNDLGGKTGTTQNHSDGWFIGVTPVLIGGVWSGCEDRFVRFNNIHLGQGANMALPIWGLFFQKVYADPFLAIDQEAKFIPPLSRLTIETDCTKYKQKEAQTKSSGKFGAEFE